MYIPQLIAFKRKTVRIRYEKYLDEDWPTVFKIKGTDMIASVNINVGAFVPLEEWFEAKLGH